MKDEGNVGATPWRLRIGWLNRRDDEIDVGSSSGRGTSGCCCGRRRRGRGSGWVADGAGWGVSWRVVTASVYEWVGGWDGSGEPFLRDALVQNVG